MYFYGIMWLRIFFILALSFVWPPIVSAAPDKIVCYHETRSYWRTGYGKFTVPDIDTNLCTHLIYGFVGINNDGTIYYNNSDLNNPGFLDLYKQVKNDRNPKPKLIASTGGRSGGSSYFLITAVNANSRKKLLESTLNLIIQYNFDGFDFYWEYTSDSEASIHARNFVTLLSEFRTEFNKRGYLLTATVSASPRYYDVLGIASKLDLIVLMTYDLAKWNGLTQHYSSFPDCVATVNAWRIAGAPPNKLVLGISAYGRSFTLKNSSNNGIGAPVSGFGAAGLYTGEKGILAYNEICHILKPGYTTQKWSNELSVPFAYQGSQWFGYDDSASIAIKGKYVVDNNLAGMMLWSVDADDFRGVLGSKYPLLNAIKTALKLQNSTSGSTTTTGTLKSIQPLTSPLQRTLTATVVCKAEGYMRDPYDCSKYYYCQWNGSLYILHTFRCSNGLCYDTKSGVCSGQSFCKAEGYIRDLYDCSKYYYCQLFGSSYITHTFQCASGLYFDTRNDLCNWPDQVSCP